MWASAGGLCAVCALASTCWQSATAPRSAWGKLLGAVAAADLGGGGGGSGATQQVTDVKKLMNEGKMDGCLYRGRTLVAVGIHPKGDAPLYTFKQPPSETEWMLCVELYEASDLPFEKDPRVVISVGPNEVATTHRVETEGPASRRAQWYQIAYMKLNYPDDPAQLPDIFVNLYKGDDRTSYERFSPRSITRFKDMYPEWVHLKCDPFGSLGKQDYPGTLFMSIGLGRKSEWDELVRSGGSSQAFQDRETARQGKEDTDAAQRKGDMLLSEERLQLARFIVTRHDRELKDLFLKPPPKGGEGREKQRKYNMFWLDNIEMIMDQMDPPPPRDLLEKMKGAFKEAKDRKQPHNNKQEPASNWVDKANSDVKGTEWARLDGLQAQVETSSRVFADSSSQTRS